MINTRTLAIVIATSLATVGTASAQDMYKTGMGGAYAGLNYTFLNLETGNADADVDTLSAKIGVMATPYLGFEARGGFGVNDERIRGVDYSLDNFFGGYATFNLANESPITPYVIAGFTRVEIEANSFLGSATEDETDVSFGIGMTMEFAPNLSGNLEYMRYYEDSDAEIDGLGIGIQVNF